MRQAINENRTVQIGLIAVLALVGIVAFMISSKGKGNPNTVPATGATSSTTVTPPATGTTTPATGTAAPTSTPAAGGASFVPVSMVPGPGLPKSMLAAYHGDETIALYVRRAGGIDDARVKRNVERLRAIPGVKVYVTTAEHIARYTWLTQAVDVTELPALIVVSPRSLTGGHPTATVSYGFRGPQSVAQAVRDAVYKGPTLPYHP